MRLRQVFYMDLGNNALTGTVPADIGTDYVRMRHLFLDHNSLEGPFPTEVLNGGEGRLKELTLNNNKFTGTFPGHSLSPNIMGTFFVCNPIGFCSFPPFVSNIPSLCNYSPTKNSRQQLCFNGLEYVPTGCLCRRRTRRVQVGL